MRNHAIVWVGSLVLMCWTIAFAPVQRTQEARVVESAREMIASDAGWRGWMIPRANGIVRLQKPPLAYWMSAISFKLFGVRDWAGRLPMALCGWLTVMITYRIAARQLASMRAGVWAAALLVGSFLFHRYARLAETDVLVTLALTIATYAIWRGFELTDRRELIWFALSGVAIGFAAIAKGAPALYPILFLVAMTLITRRWRVLLRWTLSGAPILAALIGLPWWIYARSLPQGAIIGRELSVLLDEPNHPGWFFVYLPFLLRAMLPWSPIVVIALIDAGINWRRDLTIRGRMLPLLIWCGAILLPLLFLGNKQDHYLLPMMPPLAIIAAWWLDRADQRWTRWITIIGSISLGLIALALPFAARLRRGDIVTTDLLIALALLVIAVIVFLQRRGAIDTFCVACAITMSALIGVWWPAIDTRTPREVAAEIRELGPASYCFYGENFSLPLVYHLRTIVPQARDARELTQLMSDHPNLLIIAQTKSNVAPPPVPIGCQTVREIFMKDQKFEIYRSIQ